MSQNDPKKLDSVAIEKTPTDEINIDSLIIVRQIPIIEERLQEIKGLIQAEVDNALSLECTEENKQQIKNLRSDLTKRYKALEADRKKIKDIVLGPYNDFEETYKECVTNIFKPADVKLKEKIAVVENAQKEAKRIKAIEFFNEYASANNIDFVSFDNVGVEVTLSVSEKKLKETCKAFIDKIVDDIALINTQEYKPDILVEYKKTLNVSQAITTVKSRKQAIEDEKKRIAEAEERAKAEKERQKAIDAAIAKENEANEKKAVVIPSPVDVPTVQSVPDERPQEQLYNVKFAFQLYAVTKEKAINAREYFKKYLESEGIKYDITK